MPRRDVIALPKNLTKDRKENWFRIIDEERQHRQHGGHPSYVLHQPFTPRRHRGTSSNVLRLRGRSRLFDDVCL